VSATLARSAALGISVKQFSSFVNGMFLRRAWMERVLIHEGKWRLLAYVETGLAEPSRFVDRGLSTSDDHAEYAAELRV